MEENEIDFENDRIFSTNRKSFSKIYERIVK